jgi:pyruvate/2-oxoglutarate dehydrogenase complex dihydrolipoamide dehydrogenase (E3) component
MIVADGRTPLHNDLGLENIEIETNEFCQTNIENIYAVGEGVAGKNLFAYTAQNEGALTAENAFKGNFIAADNFIVCPTSCFCGSAKYFGKSIRFFKI